MSIAGGRMTRDYSTVQFWDYAHKPDFIEPSYDPVAVAKIKARFKTP